LGYYYVGIVTVVAWVPAAVSRAVWVVDVSAGTTLTPTAFSQSLGVVCGTLIEAVSHVS
jgi:hypothetical protein